MAKRPNTAPSFPADFQPVPRQQAEQAPTTKADDPTLLTDAEADWMLDRIGWTFARDVNSAAFHQAFGAGAVFGVREERRARAREFVRMFARVER